MKNYRSPLQDKVQAVINESSPYKTQATTKRNRRPSPVLINKSHEQEHRRNANSIKKVLKELTELKKELKEMKNQSRQQQAGPGLDMSQCRKISRLNQETRKSSSPPFSKSRSSEKQRSSSKKKDQKLKRNVREFSFSIDEPKQHRSDSKKAQPEN